MSEYVEGLVELLEAAEAELLGKASRVHEAVLALTRAPTPATERAELEPRGPEGVRVADYRTVLRLVCAGLGQVPYLRDELGSTQLSVVRALVYLQNQDLVWRDPDLDRWRPTPKGIRWNSQCDRDRRRRLIVHGP